MSAQTNFIHNIETEKNMQDRWKQIQLAMLSGRSSRREFLRDAAALGISATMINGLLIKASHAQVIQVGNIACTNQAGFVMQFWITYVDIAGDGSTRWTDNNTGDYPVGQTRVFDLGQGRPPIPEGALCWPTVKAVLGNQVDGVQKVIYSSNNRQTATYLVQGTTLNYAVNKI
jgi:hypothetical protein